ncbi:F-actin-uncapping protein LRRC16A-like [Acropora palmata]|uniref:F-actin-uncapping protein LRRC16A-like n=1 Tax=Acropora palmata TaxID=6131 RepID=UPI003DA05202
MADDSSETESGLLKNVQLAIRRDIELSFVKKAKIEFKGDRSEVRILALSAHRFYVLTTSKNGCKVDFSVHVLEIQNIESSKPLLITLSCGDKSHHFRVSQPKDTIEIIAHILVSLKSNYPSGNPDRLLRVTYGPPEESDQRQAQVSTLVNNLRNMEGDVETGPCGGFSKVYVSMCDYYGPAFLEEVVWDIDTIYLSLNAKELNIQDFDHLEQKDLVPIISTLEYNEWFTKISCDSFKLGSEVCDAIIRVVKKSSTIEELVLDNVSFGRDYCQKLALALTSNPKTTLNSLSLNGNSIEDRGVVHLAGILCKLPHGLVSLSLADNGITSKGAISLGQALKSNKYNESSLQKMDLSKNPFKGEGVAGLCEFLAKPNMLTHLNLSGTECPLDLLFGAVFRGCVQHLASINLSGNTFTSKKSKDATVPPSFQQFFSSAQALKLLDMSDCKLPAEAVRAILKGLNENNVLCGVELNISSNELRATGAKAIADHVKKLKSVSRLDISDNGFEGDLVHILAKVASNTSIKHLNLGQNTKHSKSSGVVMEALVQLISEENSHLESISLAESKLKEDIIPLLDAMGTNESVKELDISGNHMGDEGARILAKAVQINSKLRTLSWDKNGTSYRGFADIAAALECNHTLLSMPMPLHDAAQSLKPQTEENLRKIEKLLLRNQSPHKAVTDQAYRLQQGLLLASTQQQMVDQLTVQLQDLISELRLSKDTDAQNEIKTAKNYVQDADKLKQLLLKFHLCTDDLDLEARFAELAAEFHKAAEDKMKSNLDKMIDCAKEVCPYVTSTQDVKSRLEAVVQNKPQLSETFVEEVILTQAAAGIANRLSEDKLAVASVMVDTIMEVVIHQLENSVLKLDLLVKDQRNKMEQGENGVANSVDEDDVAVVARKARNRLSASQLAVPATEGSDLSSKNCRRRPTVSRPRRPGPDRVVEAEEEEEKGGKDEVKVAKDVMDAKPPPQPSVKLELADLPAVEPKALELTHLGKDRPRPPRKRRPPTRPSNMPAVAHDSSNGDAKEEEEEEDIESFWLVTAESPTADVTPTKRKTSTPKSPTTPTQTTPPSKTPPPKIAPKPKPSPKPNGSEENKKSGWMPKGGINIQLPGFLKRKARDRALTGPGTGEGSASWHTSKGEKKTKEVSPKLGRDRASTQKLPEVKKEKVDRTLSETKTEALRDRVPSDNELEGSKERVPSVKKPEVSKERVPLEKKPVVSKENIPAKKETEVSKENIPTEKETESSNEQKPEETSTENKPEVTPPEKQTKISKEGKLSDKKPEGARPLIMGVKPFVSPTGVPQPRERTATGDQATKPTRAEPAPPLATAKKPPKFGIGIGGAAGGGLLAEMKLRQERGASFERKKVPLKPVDSKPKVEAGAGDKKAEWEVTKEKLVKPSSLKRPKIPSGIPPKPAPRPPKKESPKEVEKPAVEKNEDPSKQSVADQADGEKVEVGNSDNQVAKKEEKPEVKKEDEKFKEENNKDLDKTSEKLGDTKKETNPMSEGAENEKIMQNAEKPEQKGREEKTTEDKEIPDKTIEKKEKVTIAEPTNKVDSMDDLWLRRESGKEALRPGGRSLSLKVQRSTSAEKAASARSATLPKPWSPGQAASSMLSRKLSWELPKVGSEDLLKAKTMRSDSLSEEAIKEDSEEQIPKTPTSSHEDAMKGTEKGGDEAEVTKTSDDKTISSGNLTLEEILSADGETNL